jgi:hypothetical protein
MNFKEFKEFKDIVPVYPLNYFDSRVCEEENPVKLSSEINLKYEELDMLFEEFFDENGLQVAKNSSKEEREKRKLDDSSFVYGEIVNLSYLIKMYS